ncbi:MAG: molybdate ABC transporter substrate-binding protein [Nitrospiraceae bacterium]
MEVLTNWNRRLRALRVCMWSMAVAVCLCIASFKSMAAQAVESLVIAASPSVAEPIAALGAAFEAAHPGVAVQVVLNSGLELRRTIAGIENRPIDGWAMPTGPIHLVAPGGDELITRLEQKAYVLPGTRRPYAAVPLVMIVPESLVDAPASFDALVRNGAWRIAVADPELTTVGQRTRRLLGAAGAVDAQAARLDVSPDVGGVLDHLLSGQADVGIVVGPDAYRHRERVRVAAVAPPATDRPIVHSIAMLHACPDRALAERFLTFTQTPDARRIVERLGYVGVGK